jgi:nifR3 family TIM-barrel protein
MIDIGPVSLNSPVIAAPLAGVSNEAFRALALRFGAGLVCNEMVSDKALFYGSARTEQMCESHMSQHPLSNQLFGHDIETMVFGAQYLDKHTDCDIIDINMGCPVTKVIKAKAGSFLMKDPEYAQKLMTEIVRHVDKPVTVKMRIGFDHDHINCVEMAQRMEAAGVKAVSVHGRTRSQMYEGKADWSWIKKVKDAVSIPVFGNGDVTSADDFEAMMEQTGCDGVMIGRGIIGNPFLLQECADRISGQHHEHSIAERIVLCQEHARMLAQLKGEERAVKEMRGIASWYFKGLPGCRVLKDRLSHMESLEDLDQILASYEL